MSRGYEYKVRIVNGVPVVECRSEEIINLDGTKSVVVHAPSLSVIGKFLDQQGKKEEKNGKWDL